MEAHDRPLPSASAMASALSAVSQARPACSRHTQAHRSANRIIPAHAAERGRPRFIRNFTPVIIDSHDHSGFAKSVKFSSTRHRRHAERRVQPVLRRTPATPRHRPLGRSDTRCSVHGPDPDGYHIAIRHGHCNTVCVYIWTMTLSGSTSTRAPTVGTHMPVATRP